MTKLKRLEKAANEAKAEWARAVDYAVKVAREARKREEFIYWKGPASKRYDKAIKALRKARADHAADELVRVNRRACARHRPGSHT